MSDETLWAVNIQGPDDLIAVTDSAAAIRIANIFNIWWQGRTRAEPLNKYDPRMWAVPIEWPHSAASHATDLENPSEDYARFITAPSPADEIDRLTRELAEAHAVVAAFKSGDIAKDAQQSLSEAHARAETAERALKHRAEVVEAAIEHTSGGEEDTGLIGVAALSESYEKLRAAVTALKDAAKGGDPTGPMEEPK